MSYARIHSLGLAALIALTSLACSQSGFTDTAARHKAAKSSRLTDGRHEANATTADGNDGTGDGKGGGKGDAALDTGDDQTVRSAPAMACGEFRSELRGRWLSLHLHDDLANGVDTTTAIQNLGQRLQLMEAYGFGAADSQRLQDGYAFLVDGQNAPSAVEAARIRDEQALLLTQAVRIADSDCSYIETKDTPAGFALVMVEEATQVKKGEKAGFAVGRSLLDQAYAEAQKKAADQTRALAEAQLQVQTLQAEANKCRFADPGFSETLDCAAADGTHGTWRFGNYDQDTTGPCGKRFVITKADWYFDGTNGQKACAAGDRCFFWDFYDVKMGWHSRHSVIIRSFDSKSCNVVFTRENTGCFAGDVRLKLADGSEKKASEVAKGDRLYNPLTKRSVEVSRVIFGPETKPLYDVGYEGGTAVRVTEEHVFPTASGLKQARELAKGDLILDAAGKPRAVTRLTTVVSSAKVVVWNFEVKGGNGTDADHMVLADGVATGDLWLQEQLKARAKGLATTGRPSAP